eukprot:SAG31_NODE_754_length_12324_cov_3.930061_6_plen_117_part_00
MLVDEEDWRRHEGQEQLPPKWPSFYRSFVDPDETESSKEDEDWIPHPDDQHADSADEYSSEEETEWLDEDIVGAPEGFRLIDVGLLNEYKQQHLCSAISADRRESNQGVLNLVVLV